MMKTVSLFLATFIAFLCAGALLGASYVVPPDDVFVGKARVIVVARAVATHVEKSLERGIETVTEFSVEDMLKNDHKIGSAFQIRMPGGRLGDEAKIVAGAPHFEDGAEYLLFLNGRNGVYATTDFALGSFSLKFDDLGHKVAVREEGDIFGWDLNGQPHREFRREAAAFMRYIREVTRGVTPAVNYVIESRPLVGEAHTESPTGHLSVTPQAFGFAASGYTMVIDGTGETGFGSRWSTFPTAVNWNQGNTETNAPGGGTTAITTAFTAWDGDLGSNVNYQLTSSTPNSNGITAAADGVNNIVFEQNLTAYGAAFSCVSGGLLGVGGISNASSVTNSAGGSTFWTNLEGDVSMNQGVGACIGGSLSVANFNSAVMHEVGHTLSWRHADKNRINTDVCSSDVSLDCASSAIMTAVVTNGLNGIPQQWETHALRSVYPAAVEDFNADTKSDIILRDLSNGNIAEWQMNGMVIASGAMVATPGTSWSVVATGDFNGDGKADIALQDTSGNVAIWLMNGFSITSGAVVSSPGPAWKVIASGDFNADTKSDLVLQNQTTGDVAVWLMNGMSVSAGAVINSPGTAWKVLMSGDFNHDGKGDLVLQNSLSGDVAIWLVNGFTVTSGAVISSPGTLWVVKAVGDYSGNGPSDLMLRNSATGDIAEWQISGTVLTGGAVISTPGTAYDVRGSADYNADGYADLLLQNPSNGNVVVWLLNGFTVSSGAIVGAPGANFVAIAK